jgi:hypothetical protein
LNPNRAADIVFLCGGTGSGKSYEIHRQLERRRPARLIVVDPDGEYTEAGYLHSSVRQAVQATAYASFRTRFRPSHIRAQAEQQFDALCQLVRWHSGGGASAPPAVGPVVFVVDELADFVGPSFRESPESWQWLIRRGRKYGVTLIAASQRPAHIDKTIFDLATTVRTGRLNNLDSCRALASPLGVPVADVAALTGHEFIERDRNSGRLIVHKSAKTPRRVGRPAANP